jgi:asparagine synthase (glutamine-hydrolysing)
MCGIMAMYSAGEPLSCVILEEALPRLAHRGPDGQRTWFSGDGRVGLGHTRLSIIDLATGDQPIASEDEGLRIVVNGEFYDQAKVVALLDSLPALTDDARTAFDPILMVLLSACCLHERYKL